MKKLYLTALIIFFVTKTYAGSLGGAGSNYFAYQPYHNVFYDQQSAVGVVRMANGFSVVTRSAGAGSTHGASVYLDTSISVSGYIDLKDTNTMILLSDLRLDNGASFSSSGKIYGKDRTIFLGGDLNIPNSVVLHFGGRVAIDGKGNSINVGENSQFFVDTGATLTLRNLVLSNSKNGVGNPAIKLASPSSQLALDNTILDMTGDFYFDKGGFFIHNDVLFTGTNAFIYRSCQPSFITSGATLNFDAGTTFSFAPSTFTACPYTVSRTYTSSNFINMQDSTSKLIFNGCDFHTTLTGLNLTKGKVFFNNNVRMFSCATNKIPKVNIVDPTVYSINGISGANFVDWSPDGRYISTTSRLGGTLQVFGFDGKSNPVLVGSVAVANGPYGPRWSPDGKYLAIATNGGAPFVLSVYSFAGGNPVLVGSGDIGDGAWLPEWSPDGRYLAVTNYNLNRLKVFNFNLTGKPILVGAVVTDTFPSSLSWSPDGKYIAVINGTSNTLQIFTFSGSGNPTYVSKVSTPTLTNEGYVDWSPDGRYIAITTEDSNFLQIFRFKENVAPVLVSSTSTLSRPMSVRWSKDGRFLAVSCFNSNLLQIFDFSNENATLIGSANADSGVFGVSWSWDGKYVAASGWNAGTLKVFKVNYVNNSQQQAISNSIVFGNSSLGSNYDVDLRLLSEASVELDGLVNYDNVS